MYEYIDKCVMPSLGIWPLGQKAIYRLPQILIIPSKLAAIDFVAGYVPKDVYIVQMLLSAIIFSLRTV